MRNVFSPTGLAVLAGVILALAYPPFPLGFLAYGALALAIHATGLSSTDPPPIQTIARKAWVFGSVFHLTTLYWVGWVAIPGMLTMVVILGLYVAAVFAATAYLRKRIGPNALWLFPCLWIAHEYLRGLGPLAFPWTNLSLTQVGYTTLIQYADMTGDLGVGFLIVLLNLVLLRLAQRVREQKPVWAHVVVLILGFLAPFLYGRLTLSRLKDAEAVRVAVLQGDIDSFRKWSDDFVDQSFAVYETQTREAAASGAELIVWPETAAPMYLRVEENYHSLLRLLSRELDASLLVGTLEYSRRDPGGYHRYNAAVAVDRGRYQPEFHAKLRLVPFGEWIPFSDQFQVLDNLEVGGAHFTAGSKYVLFEHRKGPYAAAICFESAFPDVMRCFAQQGARFFVNITNDGWYGFTSGPAQHAAIAVYRAIETRRPIARAANTGISGFIDRAGRFVEQTHQYVPDVHVYDLGLGAEGQSTFFVLHGMWLGQLCLLISVAAMGSALVFRTLRRV